MRAVLASRPSEATLLVFAMLSGVFHFLGTLATLWLGREASGLGQDELLSRIGAEFAGALVFRTLALYGVALAAWAIARAFGGAGSIYASRAALFWSALVAAPVMLGAALLSTLAGPFLGGHAGAVFRIAGGLAFAVAFAFCLAQAQGFRSGWRVLAVMALLAMAAFTLLAILSSLI